MVTDANYDAHVRNDSILDNNRSLTSKTTISVTKIRSVFIVLETR